MMMRDRAIPRPAAGAPPSDHLKSRSGPSLRLRGWAETDGATLFPAVDLSFPAARWTAILGRSGAGKTSLLRAVAGLLPAGALHGSAEAGDGAPIAGRVAWMAQDALLPPWSPLIDAVALGPRLRGEASDPAASAAALAACGLAGLERRRPTALSGGQRQRAALARLLVENRPIALLDEPLSALDALTRAEIAALLADRLAGRTVLHVTHDPVEAAQLAHHAAVLTAEGAAWIDIAGAPPRAWDAPETLATARALRAALGAAPDGSQAAPSVASTAR